MRDLGNFPKNLLKTANQKFSVFLLYIRPFIPQAKDIGVLAGWIAALILIAGLSWFLTQPVRSRFLLQAVNRVLEQSGDRRRLGEPVPESDLKAGLSRMGAWHTVRLVDNSGYAGIYDGRRALIFTFIGEGAFFPCVVLVSPEGKVEEFIPLSSYGERMMKRFSPGISRVYARRIEARYE